MVTNGRRVAKIAYLCTNKREMRADFSKPTPPTANPDWDMLCMITFRPPIRGISEVMADEHARQINLQLARDIVRQIEQAQAKEKVKIVFLSDVERYIELLSGEGFGALHVTRTFAIELPFYNVRIALPPLAKAIYILYMRHRDGFYRKQIAEPAMADELRRIYRVLQPTRSEADIAQTIADLTDFSKKNLDRQMSLINKAFRAHLGDKAAHYLPTGKRRGEPRSLDFECVSFSLPETLADL